MISCEIVRRHVDTVVDGEVDPDTQIEFEQHLASCGPCRVHLSFARAFKERVREACLPAAAPSSLADRIRAALDAEDSRRATGPAVAVTAVAPALDAARLDAALLDADPVNASPRGAEAATPSAHVSADAALLRRETEAPARATDEMRWGSVRLVPLRARYAVPAAAAAVALAVLAQEGGNPVRGPALGESVEGEGLSVDVASTASAGSLLDEVVRRHSSEHPPEVTGPPTQVATWFRGKVEFPVQPIEFSRPDVQLVGGRISNVRDREAAAFFYDVHGRRVTVMVFQPPATMHRFVRHTRVRGRGLYYGYGNGRPVTVVEHHGLTYAIAGDLDERALLQLAATARVP